MLNLAQSGRSRVTCPPQLASENIRLNGHDGVLVDVKGVKQRIRTPGKTERMMQIQEGF